MQLLSDLKSVPGDLQDYSFRAPPQAAAVHAQCAGQPDEKYPPAP